MSSLERDHLPGRERPRPRPPRRLTRSSTRRRPPFQSPSQAPDAATRIGTLSQKRPSMLHASTRPDSARRRSASNARCCRQWLSKGGALAGRDCTHEVALLVPTGRQCPFERRAEGRMGPDPRRTALGALHPSPRPGIRTERQCIRAVAVPRVQRIGAASATATSRGPTPRPRTERAGRTR